MHVARPPRPRPARPGSSLPWTAPKRRSPWRNPTSSAWNVSSLKNRLPPANRHCASARRRCAPAVEQLQLHPTESTDPDEVVQKTGPEDLVIKGFAYDDLDRIHENTRERDFEDDDFDMHAAIAERARREAEENRPGDETPVVQDGNDDDLHVVIDYAALAQKEAPSTGGTDDTK